MKRIACVSSFGSGDVVLSSRTDVVITVVNRAMPIFVEPYYSTSVPENVQSFTPILTVSARSPMGNSLVYSIVSGDEYGEFAVDFNIGELTPGRCFSGKKTLDKVLLLFSVVERCVFCGNTNANPSFSSFAFYLRKE